MSDFIGLGLLAVGLVLLAAIARWFRDREGSETGWGGVLGDGAALLVSGFIVTGSVTVIATVALAWRAGDMTHVLFSLVALALFVAGVRYVPGWLARRSTP